MQRFNAALCFAVLAVKRLGGGPKEGYATFLVFDPEHGNPFGLPFIPTNIKRVPVHENILGGLLSSTAHNRYDKRLRQFVDVARDLRKSLAVEQRDFRSPFA